MKHALASANPENNEWSICTRTKDNLENNKFIKISSPYRFSDFEAEEYEISEKPWEGKYNSTGTLVTFVCSNELYRTLAKGIKGGLKDFRSIAALLYEDLGFVYADIIKNARAIIYLRIIPIHGSPEQKSVGALDTIIRLITDMHSKICKSHIFNYAIKSS